MRKLILISALLLASASAQAGPTSGVALAAADTPAAASTDTAQPLPPVAQSDTAQPQASTPAAQPRGSKQRAHVRGHESDEAKARRIAAKYGISW
jgi:hypothetical protein